MSGKRDATVDVAKGIAIILIVVGHVLRGLSASGLVDAHAPWYGVADAALYETHLAAFVFLAGLFVSSGAVRRGVGPYLRGRLATLAYVYVVWTLLQGGVKVATASLVNTPLTPWGVVSSLWRPDGQLWYLPFFALLTTITVLAQPWRSAPRAATAMILAIGLSVAAWGDVWGDLFFQRGWALAPFFVMGVVMGHRRFSEALERAAQGWGVALPAAVVFVFVQFQRPIAPTSAPDGIDPAGVMWGALGAITGVALLVGVSRIVARAWLGSGLAALGAASMEIFLAHITVASGSRILLVKAHVTQPAVVIAVGTVLGVLLPYLLAVLARRYSALRLLFQLPEAVVRRIEGRTPPALG